MRYVQLRAFHYVAVSGGFSRAAEALCLTQPAISDQVRKLEEQYEVLLFNRHKRQVVLTTTGERLLDITRRLFEIENHALELLSESQGLRLGSLRIVADSAHHVLHILQRFRELYPGIDVKIFSGNSEEVVAKLHSYDADLGVLGEAPRSKDFESVRLNTTPLVAFVAKEHPLGHRAEITLAELAQQALVLRERGSKTRQSIEKVASEAKIELTAAIEAEGREAVREIVSTGVGVGIVSKAEFGSDERFNAIAITDCDCLMEETLICLRERACGKMVRAFFNIAHELSDLQPV